MNARGVFVRTIVFFVPCLLVYIAVPAHVAANSPVLKTSIYCGYGHCCYEYQSEVQPDSLCECNVNGPYVYRITNNNSGDNLRLRLSTVEFEDHFLEVGENNECFSTRRFIDPTDWAFRFCENDGNDDSDRQYPITSIEPCDTSQELPWFFYDHPFLGGDEEASSGGFEINNDCDGAFEAWRDCDDGNNCDEKVDGLVSCVTEHFESVTSCLVSHCIRDASNEYYGEGNDINDLLESCEPSGTDPAEPSSTGVAELADMARLPVGSEQLRSDEEPVATALSVDADGLVSDMMEVVTEVALNRLQRRGEEVFMELVTDNLCDGESLDMAVLLGDEDDDDTENESELILENTCRLIETTPISSLAGSPEEVEAALAADVWGAAQFLLDRQINENCDSTEWRNHWSDMFEAVVASLFVDESRDRTALSVQSAFNRMITVVLEDDDDDDGCDDDDEGCDDGNEVQCR